MPALKFIICFWLLVTGLLVTPVVQAQESTQSASVSAIPSQIYPTSPLYTDFLVNNMFHSYSCLVIGASVIGHPCLTYQSGMPVLSQINTTGGALGSLTSVLEAMYVNPPIKTGDYLATLGQGLGIVKEAQAQGVTGSSSAILSPILKLWQTSRNIAYIAMIIIFVVIGLMVMFRQRINPQTVITAQAALPGLVIGLVLITFSYFFAALISDTAFIATNLVGYYFTAAQGAPPQDLVSDSQGQNVLSIFSKYTSLFNKETISDVVASIWDNFNGDTQNFLRLISAFTMTQLVSQPTEAFKAIPNIGAGIQAVVVGASGLFGALNPQATVGLLFFFTATAALIYAMFKLLLRLVNCYLHIIWLTITAPFHFLIASMPGRQGVATNWVFNMLCNVLAFPAVLGVFYFITYLLGPNRVDLSGLPFVISGSLGVTGSETFPLFGGLNLGFINILLAFGALIATPSIPDIVCKIIGRPGAAGQMLGQEISGGINQGRTYGNQVQSGISATGGYIAGARGLSGTPAYMPTEFDKNGNPIGWAMNPHQYQPNIIQKRQARAFIKEKSAGNFTQPTTEET